MKTWLKGITIALIVLIVLFFAFAPSIIDRTLNPVHPKAQYFVSPEAQALHNTLVIGDWHADSLLWGRNLNQRHDHGHVDIPRLLEGNVSLQVFTAVTKSPRGQNYHSNATNTGDNIDLLSRVELWPLKTWNSLLNRARFQAQQLHKFSDKSEGQLFIIKNQTDLDYVLEQKQFGHTIVGGMLGLEGAHPLEGDLNNLDLLYKDGYRLIGLLHFFDNELGGSLHGKSGEGLTDFGRTVVQAANQQHWVIDLAHASHQVVKETLALVDRPVVLSHTGIHKHHPVHRNIPDELMVFIAQNGGVIGIGYWADVLGDHSPAGIVKAIKAGIDLVGEDHIALGSDFDGAVGTALDTSQLAALTDQMLKQGFKETTIKKVMGENMVRVLKTALEKK